MRPNDEMAMRGQGKKEKIGDVVCCDQSGREWPLICLFQTTSEYQKRVEDGTIVD